MDKCEKDEDGNIIDPITYDIVPIDRVIIVPIGIYTHCFDIETLSYLMRQSPIIGNPFTRQPWPGDIIKQVEEYEKNLEKTFDFLFLEENIRKNIKITIHIPINFELGELLIELFRKYGDLGKINNVEIRMNGIIMPIYDLKTKLGDIPDLKNDFLILPPIVETKQYDDLNFALYKYAIDKDLEWLKFTIPKVYHTKYEPDPPIMETFLALQDQINNFTGNLSHDKDSMLNLSRNARITSEQANILISQLPEQYMKENIFYHIIYSKVVDKHNMNVPGWRIIYERGFGVKPNYDLIN